MESKEQQSEPAPGVMCPARLSGSSPHTDKELWLSPEAFPHPVVLTSSRVPPAGGVRAELQGAARPQGSLGGLQIGQAQAHCSHIAGLGRQLWRSSGPGSLISLITTVDGSASLCFRYRQAPGLSLT